MPPYLDSVLEGISARGLESPSTYLFLQPRATGPNGSCRCNRSVPAVVPNHQHPRRRYHILLHWAGGAYSSAIISVAFGSRHGTACACACLPRTSNHDRALDSVTLGPRPRTTPRAEDDVARDRRHDDPHGRSSRATTNGAWGPLVPLASQPGLRDVVAAGRYDPSSRTLAADGRPALGRRGSFQGSRHDL